MDFFESQRKARSNSKLMVIAMVLATIAIVMAINIIVLIFLGWHGLATLAHTSPEASVINGLFSSQFIGQHASTLAMTSTGIASVIGLCSLGKILSLRDGGAKVARQMGGDLITPNDRDPLRQRLHNVVEEIAIASGMPVPEVYVMEHEAGINAFAAGYAQSDAAIAVTRGTLERLDRSELQGVIAHEFSHILNGDMRINIRIMGLVFGIMILAILGRKMLSSGHHNRISSRDGKGTSVIVMVGLGVMVIGYIGLFFARWMKAAISRQREYLADASAVQFTREADGIANALKKIGAHQYGSYLSTDSEEVSHMLFGQGEKQFFNTSMFATHPPILDRIQRLQPSFKENDLEDFAKKLDRQRHNQAEQAEKELAEKKTDKKRRPFNVERVINDIGHPQLEQILAAAVLAQSLPDQLEQAAHSVEWAPEVALFSLLSSNKKIRDKQLLIIIEEYGEHSEKKIQYLVTHCKNLSIEHRLPLLEIAFPELKRRPLEDLHKLLNVAKRLVLEDSHIDPFEYLLTKVLDLHIQNANHPNKTIIVGNKRIEGLIEEIVAVMAILAVNGHPDLSSAQSAFDKGMRSLGFENKPMKMHDDWVARIDNALFKLNKLRAPDKKRLVYALAESVMHDGSLSIAEHELLRAICATIHVPLPILA